MKKIIFAFTLLLLIVCLLAGCGGGTDDKSNDTSSDTSGTDTSTEPSWEGDTPEDDNCEHSFSEWVVVREADCTQKGMRTRDCSLCGTKKLEYMEPKGHSVVVLEAVQGNCKEQDGYTRGEYCSVCNETLIEQVRIPKEELHNLDMLVGVSKEPTLTSSGKATFRCSVCQEKKEEILPKLTSVALGKDDIYDITTDEYNPAIDNIWKVVDGNKESAGLYAAGADWFGNVGDTLLITLEQEVVLTDMYLYVYGNYTTATVTIKNALGKTVKSGKITADGNKTLKIIAVEGGSVEAYTIEIAITALKWESAYTFKVAEIEMKAAKPDTRLPHDHVYREYVKETVKATCKAHGKAEYACYCGRIKEQQTPYADHSYTVLTSSKPVTCTENGKDVYKCETCTSSIEKKILAKGHIYAKLVEYISMPTNAKHGKATFMCVGCNETEDKTLVALPLGEVEHLRVTEIGNNSVTLKFNVYGEAGNFEVRYSTSEITSENFESAGEADAAVRGEKEYTVTINGISAGLNNGYYVAIRPYIGENYGDVVSIRVGGNKLIPIDYHSGNVYHGELLSSFAELFDEQKYERTKTPTSVLKRIITDSNDDVLFNMDLRPIVDLEYMHYVSSVYIHNNSSNSTVTVRWSDTPIDAYATDAAWDGAYTYTSKVGWKEIKVNANARYIQVVFRDGKAPSEILVYGYQSGDGDAIATEIGSLPTMGEMMGMCGFVAGGGGNTPIDSVICTTVLREYHNIGWTYTADVYPMKASNFNTWMGNFESQYRSYTAAGINVIPCIQWDLVNYTLSYEVDENNLPKKSNGSYIKSDFYGKMNPHSYFLYADNMFAFAARFGTNDAISSVLAAHCMGATSSGAGTIKWIEMGNEPEGAWNGIHNYYSAYQLAALTSAAYDGHCRTMTSTVIDKGYHLGIKNGDPNMKAAMAGVSAVSNEYITALCYWMKANRPDGKVALDAFNVHCYMTKEITLPNGGTTYVGISPEEAGIVNTLAQLIGIRDKYYPEKEVWITEFGWDTNQSYATSTSAHAYENKSTGVSYTGREVQAMWLTRTYLLLSAIGIDKATMYMCEDCGVDTEAVGKYGSAGVIGFMYDENGDTVEFKKDSYYYLYTLKNTLGDYTFNQQIEAYDENVMVYEYKTAEGKTAYAVWCKTSDGTVANGYQIKIDGSKATLVENEYGDIDGVETELTMDNLGYVSVNVTEKPVYIVVD